MNRKEEEKKGGALEQIAEAMAGDAAGAGEGPEEKRLTFSRRALFTGGAAALGALALFGAEAGIMTVSGTRNTAAAQIAAPRVSAYLSPCIEAEGVAATAALDDAAALAETGVMGIDAEALRTAVAESKPEAAEGTEEAWVVWRFENLEPGKPYLLTARAMRPEWVEVEDPGSYPPGWKFAKTDGETAYRVGSAEELETNALVITPASPSGTACARYAAAPVDDVYFETAAALLAVC